MPQVNVEWLRSMIGMLTEDCQELEQQRDRVERDLATGAVTLCSLKSAAAAYRARLETAQALHVEVSGERHSPPATLPDDLESPPQGTSANSGFDGTY